MRQGVGSEMNIKRTVVAAALSAAMLAGVGSAAYAMPGEHGNGYGGCVNNLYGNATNPRDGGNGVIPSQSPGPWLNTGENEPPRNDRLRGPSMGDLMKLATGSGLTGQEAFEIGCGSH